MKKLILFALSVLSVSGSFFDPCQLYCSYSSNCVANKPLGSFCQTGLNPPTCYGLRIFSLTRRFCYEHNNVLCNSVTAPQLVKCALVRYTSTPEPSTSTSPPPTRPTFFPTFPTFFPPIYPPIFPPIFPPILPPIFPPVIPPTLGSCQGLCNSVPGCAGRGSYCKYWLRPSVCQGILRTPFGFCYSGTTPFCDVVGRPVYCRPVFPVVR